jgi:aminopeptidase N
MLRDLLGEEAFFKGLQEFFSRYKYGAASTKDFIKTIEEVSGKDLAVFFRNWFDSYVLPEVKVSHSVLKGEGGYILKLRITQPKELFVFPLWVEWSENGNRVKKRLIIDEKKEEFDFELKSKPRKIKINPNKAVPGRFN